MSGQILSASSSSRSAVPRQRAAANGHPEVVKLLLDAGANRDVLAEGDSLLSLAAWSGDAATLELVLDQADADRLKPRAQRALYTASLLEDKTNAEMLLNSGIRVGVTGDNGNDSLLVAASRGELSAVRWRLSQGADPRRRYHLGNTALGLAAYMGHLEVVEELLEAGADIENRTDHGGTALRGAAGKGHIEVVKWLLNAGADPSVEDNFGRLAVTYARENGHDAIAELLENAAAQPRSHHCRVLFASPQGRVLRNPEFTRVITIKDLRNYPPAMSGNVRIVSSAREIAKRHGADSRRITILTLCRVHPGFPASGYGAGIGSGGQGFPWSDDTNASICWRTSLGLLMMRSCVPESSTTRPRSANASNHCS